MLSRAHRWLHRHGIARTLNGTGEDVSDKWAKTQRQYDDDVAELRAAGGMQGEPRRPDLSWMDERVGPYPIQRQDSAYRVIQRWPNFETIREVDGSLVGVQVVGLQPSSVLELLGGLTNVAFMGYALPDGYHAGPPIRGLHRATPDGPVQVTVMDRTLGELAATVRALTKTRAESWPCLWCGEAFGDLTGALRHAEWVHAWSDPGLASTLAEHGRV